MKTLILTATFFLFFSNVHSQSQYILLGKNRQEIINTFKTNFPAWFIQDENLEDSFSILSFVPSLKWLKEETDKPVMAFYIISVKDYKCYKCDISFNNSVKSDIITWLDNNYSRINGNLWGCRNPKMIFETTKSEDNFFRLIITKVPD